MSEQNLNPDQFHEAVTAAIRRFSTIRKKYPALKAHLVLSSRGDQTRIDASLQQMIEEFPALLPEGGPKAAILVFLKTPVPQKPTDDEKKQWSERFHELAETLEFDGKTHVEIRFDQLVYDLVWKLQADEMVDRRLTPQTKASIRIVLGTLAYFSEVGAPHIPSDP